MSIRLASWMSRKRTSTFLAGAAAFFCAAGAFAQTRPSNESYVAGLEASRAGKYGQAAKLYQKAAREGEREAFFMLGLLHQTGLGVPRSYRDAIILFRHVAVMGHARAQARMANLIAEGKGVQADPVTGYMWFEISVRLGNSSAMQDRLSLATRMKKSDIDLARKRAASCLSSHYKRC